jgi:hypothetical protein
MSGSDLKAEVDARALLGFGLRWLGARSHSFGLDHRRRPLTSFTAMAAAFFCPTSTAKHLPRVTPV